MKKIIKKSVSKLLVCVLLASYFLPAVAAFAETLNIHTYEAETHNYTNTQTLGQQQTTAPLYITPF